MSYFRRISVHLVFLVLLTTILSFLVKPKVTAVKFRSQNVTVLIKGTSSLHDWEMKSDQGHVEVLLGMGNNDNILGLTALKFTIEAESLKSGKSAMDKNAYKALKTGSAKNISFVLSSATVSRQNATTFQINTLGKLTVAGTTRETNIVVDVTFNQADKSFTATGTKKIKMTEYNVKPPSFMMGAVKTGDDISISFTTQIVR